MNITELYLKDINNFAHYKKDIETRVTDLGSPLMIHLLKIRLFPTSRDQNHWITEILVILTKISTFKLKKSKKKLTTSQISRWLVDGLPRKGFDIIKDSLVKEYKKEIVVVTFPFDQILNDINLISIYCVTINSYSIESFKSILKLT